MEGCRIPFGDELVLLLDTWDPFLMDDFPVFAAKFVIAFTEEISEHFANAPNLSLRFGRRIITPAGSVPGTLVLLLGRPCAAGIYAHWLPVGG